MASYKSVPTDEEPPQAVPVQPYPAYTGPVQQQAYSYPTANQGYAQPNTVYIAQQYPNQPAVYGTGPLPSQIPKERQHECGFFSLSNLMHNICNTALLFILQFFSMFAAIFSFLFVALGLFLGIGFLPLCCIGIVIFSLFNFCLRPVASLDDMLYQQRRRIYDRLLAD
ncbi:hypothetical protein THRCLA_01298 [Thraustotheca clavata]|uniref:Transmembrane protein n=1 Tax=Thraustotheca clavata TaxID=74557 RepID=A0A1W0A8P1_9STRA|nr:hypothetical protein THRCLA_01298 [Thraustotheca clavata]